MAFNKQKALERAERYAAKGQHDKAAREYRAIVDADPKDVRAWLMLADCLVRSGNAREAIDHYLQVARTYTTKKQPEKALAVFRQVLSLDPSRVDVLLAVAELNHIMGRVPDAVAAYEAVGSQHMQAGRVRDALAAFHKAADVDTGSVSRRLRLAELYSREKMLEPAVAAFRQAAAALLEAERLPDYVRVAERLLYHKKDDLPTLRELARVYLALGQPREALKKLNVLLHHEAKDTVGLELLADTFEVVGDHVDQLVAVCAEVLWRHGWRPYPLAQVDLASVMTARVVPDEPCGRRRRSATRSAPGRPGSRAAPRFGAIRRALHCHSRVSAPR